MIKYRPDIDGLRAIAVLLVLAYHLEFSFFSGGFVGVDIFFVISGYLITGIILSDISKNRFCFLNFFNRRIKRIIPSVAFVSTVTILVSYFFLLPDDFSSLIASYLYTSIYSANLFFYSETLSYFSSSSNELPLLHMWSLAVEEQFYFIWPAILIFLIRFLKSNYIVLLIVLLSIISFSFSQFISINDQPFSYYMLPTRSGGLILGSALAILQFNFSFFRDFNSRYLTLSGIIIILLSSIYISDKDIFPGFLSLLPSTGAVLIILGGSGKKNNIISKMLSVKPLVKVGLLSFSIYLWHWPIIAITNYMNINLTSFVCLAITFITLLLSYFSYFFLENPVRKLNFSFKKSFLLLNLPFIFFAVFIYIISNITNGFSYRFTDNSLENDLALNKLNVEYADLDAGWCHASSMTRNNIQYTDKIGNCFIGDKNSKITALFIGDSTAGHYAPFVDKLAKKSGVKVKQLSTSSCYPTTMLEKNGENPDLCLAFRKEIKAAVEKNEYDIVIISNRWARDNDITSYKTSYIDDTISFFSSHARTVFILGQLPEWKTDPAQCIKRQTCSSSSSFEQASKMNDAMIKINEIAKTKNNVIVIDPSYLLKINGEYSPFAMGYPMYHDTGHLSIKGMNWLADKYIRDNDIILK